MGARSLRPLGTPHALRVIAGPSGMPHAVEIDGRRRLVTSMRDDWLVQDRWWTDDPIDRHYFELVVEPGRRLVVFHDERARLWMTHEALGHAARRRTPSTRASPPLDVPHQAHPQDRIRKTR